VTSESRYCGWCGGQLRVCVDDGNGGSVWGAGSSCQGDNSGLPGACDPYVKNPAKPCGNCGTIQQTCIFPGDPAQCTVIEKEPQDCVEPPQYNGEPACKPGATKFTPGASCTGPNDGRTQTCLDTCAWGAF